MNVKSERGITLLALGVTVIVMAILVGVVLSATADDEGVINQTKISTINASIREVQEAVDTYILLKEKEEIQKGNLSSETLDLSGALTLYSENIYNLDLTELNIKGDYGKGGSYGVFRAQKISATEYEVFFVDEKGATHYSR